MCGASEPTGEGRPMNWGILVSLRTVSTETSNGMGQRLRLGGSLPLASVAAVAVLGVLLLDGRALGQSAPAQTAAPPTAAYDVVIRNGKIIDGTGSPWFAGDIGIRDGRIAAIGRVSGEG